MSDQLLKHILYVEDEPDIQTVARLALETVGGFRVTICGSGEEAVKVVRDLSPDLVLLDVMMPGMDGPSTLRRLREFPELQTTPVVFMTAKVQRSEVEHYRSLGAVGVIAKPFDPMTLSDEVLSIWKSRSG